MSGRFVTGSEQAALPFGGVSCVTHEIAHPCVADPVFCLTMQIGLPCVRHHSLVREVTNHACGVRDSNTRVGM